VQWLNETVANMYPNVIKQYLKQKYSDNDSSCAVNKEMSCLNKKKTRGLLTCMTSCGSVRDFEELITHESLSSVTSLIKEVINLTGNNIEFVIYDNACHLSSYWFKNTSTDLVKPIKFLIDRLHIGNHSRDSCRLNHNLDNEPDLKKFNSMACEQNNYIIGEYKHALKHMNIYHYNFFFLVIIVSQAYLGLILT
jgi:hypothetical protein